MSDGETSGVDLARVALRAAMGRDGREPMGLGAAIGALVTGRTWELPAAGTTLRERWEACVSALAGHVAAVSYDAEPDGIALAYGASGW
ncbi:hypothetical protein [Streptomyces sp. NPDC029674]|uniref:hypothetical protein n=1 Tax=Streptomyces sp. NPDC029674 TaxID=3365297 RepID=UPI0038515DD2